MSLSFKGCASAGCRRRGGQGRSEWPDGETTFGAQEIPKKYSGVGHCGITVHRRRSCSRGCRPAVRTGIPNLAKGGISVDSTSSNRLALRELFLNGLVCAGPAEFCAVEGAWTTEVGFGARRSVAIR